MIAGNERVRAVAPDLSEALADAIARYDAAGADFDTKGAAGARQTSVVAAVTTLPLKGSTRRDVVQLICAVDAFSQDGLTVEQLCGRLRKSHQTVSSAVNWAEAAGWIVDSGQRRMTTHRKPAIVWRPTSKATAATREASTGTEG